ncbi:MAG: hypothetical protein FD174_1304 [Geobacteraceae bacterium]|nr:MAG: hypothetical protein FD174_1304 [Geobacteraceae bacterium]
MDNLESEKRIDGTFAINIAADQMEAHLTITPPVGGGQAVNGEQIYRALEEKKVVRGIMKESLEAAAATGRADNKLIASGRKPVPGENAQLVSLIPEMKERRPQMEDESDIVNFRDLGDIISVRPGDPLMRRIPPTAGEPGENILGGTVPATPGNDMQFAPELSGSAISPDDSDLLVAAIAGQPVLVSFGVVVEPTIKLQNVDLSTGNLHFEGSIIISGDVNAGMEVTAAGDISIGGTVEAAKLEAGGDVEVKGGIIGHSQVRNGNGDLNPAIAHVQAKGSVTALFMEKALVIAGADIAVKELAMQSELTAGGRVVVGEEGMRKGHIIGGLCRATNLVHAIVIGSHASVPTRIEVGVDPYAQEKLALVKKQLDEKQKELEEVGKTLAYIQENPTRFAPETIKQKERSSNWLQTEVTELTGQKKRLQKKLENVDTARIKVEKNIYYGVQIAIGDKTLLVDDDLENVTFRLEEGAIVY